MAHTPVNHPLRPVYRALGALSGLYLILFGVLGVLWTGTADPFAQQIGTVLGQGTNLAWSIVSIVLGVVVLIATALGRNRDVVVNTYVGWALLVFGTFGLAVSRTNVNILNFTISTVIVTYIVGLFLILAGLYGKTAPEAEVGEPRQIRQRQSA